MLAMRPPAQYDKELLSSSSYDQIAFDNTCPKRV